MPSVVEKAGWFLASVGALGVSPFVHAQTSPYGVRVPAAAAASPAPLPAAQTALKPPAPPRPTSTPAAADDHARLAEMMVLLAWAADPVTSPCQLRVNAGGPMLEVAGAVPDERAKARALQLAAQQGGRAVVDS